MEAVAKAENITATEEEYEEEMKVMADAYQIEVDKVKEMMGNLWITLKKSGTVISSLNYLKETLAKTLAGLVWKKEKEGPEKGI